MAGLLDKVTDPDFFDIAAYYARQLPARAASNPDPDKLARGAALARSMGCGACHMGDFSGQKQVPRIANQREDYLVATLKAYRDNKRVPPDTSMLGIMSKASDADIEALAHLISHQ
jgi:cytochrome c553